MMSIYSGSSVVCPRYKKSERKCSDESSFEGGFELGGTSM